MDQKTDDEADGCTFQWKIENLRHCWLTTGERLGSPAFIADAVEGTKWSLSLYLMGDENENDIGFYLVREEDCTGSDEIEVNFQLAFLAKDGSFLREETLEGYSFDKSELWGSQNFETRERVFSSEKEAFIPDDTLTVQCTIWNREESPFKPKHLYARTVYKVNRKSFVWRIDKFSSLKSIQKYKLKDDFIDFDLCLNKEIDFRQEMFMHINSFDESIKYISCKISIVDSSGKKEHCGNHEYFAIDLNRGVLSMPSIQILKRLNENKSRYLPNDVLSLQCEYFISIPTGLHEFLDTGITFSKLKTERTETRKEFCIEKEKSLDISNLAMDLKSLYTDAFHCDMELRTSTHNFPAHTIILSARSPVFKSMLSKDMKEKNCGHVDITDSDDDTMHRMLLFMYTDLLEDLQFESAFKLYTIADKYEILALKNRISSFLKDNLCPTNACEVLVLADLHHDEDLANAVQDYILGERKEIFRSQQWRHFMNTHSKLAADIMLRKIFQE